MLIDQYATATRSSHLGEGRDADMLGAMGYVGKQHPVAAGMARLFAGDNGMGRSLVLHLGGVLHGHSKGAVRLVQAQEIARAVLAWHRDGVCRACHGHGLLPAPDAPMLSGQAPHRAHVPRTVPAGPAARAQEAAHA